MMYKTYQEAKINCPEACVCLDKTSGMFFVMPSREGTTLGEGCEFAEAKDHCMTVKEFLDGGYRFEVGDLWLDCDGEVMAVEELGINNTNKPHELDSERYVLRSAAMEWIKRADDADREALSRIGAQLSTIHLNKKPRTKIEFVKVVGENFFGLESDLLAGNLYCGEGEEWKIIDIPSLADEWANDNLYRRAETPMTEREAFIDGYDKLVEEFLEDETKVAGDWAGYVFDKLVN